MCCTSCCCAHNRARAARGHLVVGSSQPAIAVVEGRTTIDYILGQKRFLKGQHCKGCNFFCAPEAGFTKPHSPQLTAEGKALPFGGRPVGWKRRSEKRKRSQGRTTRATSNSDLPPAKKPNGAFI